MGEGELQLGKQKNGRECVPIQPPWSPRVSQTILFHHLHVFPVTLRLPGQCLLQQQQNVLKRNSFKIKFCACKVAQDIQTKVHLLQRLKNSFYNLWVMHFNSLFLWQSCMSKKQFWFSKANLSHGNSGVYTLNWTAARRCIWTSAGEKHKTELPLGMLCF